MDHFVDQFGMAIRLERFKGKVVEDELTMPGVGASFVGLLVEGEGPGPDTPA